MSIKPINLSATSNTKINGCIKVPGDKSISHRAIIISSIANGRTKIKGYLNSKDIDATINACRAIGADINKDTDSLIIEGNNLERRYGENVDLSFGNSGTSMRLMMGILSAQKFSSVLTGDESLNQRPMNRVTNPLLRMNADIKTSNGTPPVYINPVSFLKCVDHTIEIASAQIKSSIMLAGLYGDSVFKIITPQSRDHTEIMLNEFGCNISVESDSIVLVPGKLTTPNHIVIPGDISSAAFFIVGSIISEDSQVKIENVGLNPLRTGFIKILQMMGANIQISNERTINGELIGDIYTESSILNGIDIPIELISSSIDELPLIVLAASQANGKTSIRNAEELRVKESDRILSMIRMMGKFGISTDEFPDGMNIYGGLIKGSRVNSYGDHRIAMTALMASLVSDGDILVEDCKNIDTSFPTFIDIANNIGMDIQIND
jgi:3-phosphoshikimate 1-carboxyvinyltransferase